MGMYSHDIPTGFSLMVCEDDHSHHFQSFQSSSLPEFRTKFIRTVCISLGV